MRIEEIRKELRGMDPQAIASRCGAAYEAQQERLSLRLFDKECSITYPELAVPECSYWEEGLIIYYLHTADGTPLAYRWISFREIPGGLFYHQAYQGYSGDRLAKHFGNDIPVFAQAAENAGGERMELGDAAYAFYALPRVPLLAIYWRGDEEFVPVAQVLFDASAHHYLPTDALATLGGNLSKRIIKAASQGTK